MKGKATIKSPPGDYLLGGVPLVHACSLMVCLPILEFDAVWLFGVFPESFFSFFGGGLPYPRIALPLLSILHLDLGRANSLCFGLVSFVH